MKKCSLYDTFESQLQAVITIASNLLEIKEMCVLHQLRFENKCFGIRATPKVKLFLYKESLPFHLL